jgi:hypothetical protein
VRDESIPGHVDGGFNTGHEVLTLQLLHQLEGLRRHARVVITLRASTVTVFTVSVVHGQHTVLFPDVVEGNGILDGFARKLAEGIPPVEHQYSFKPEE